MFYEKIAIMNQVSRQKAKCLVKKHFYKLINNSNFGYDCCNNLNTCTFAPINDELDEIPYLKKYESPFDKEMSDFVICDLLEQEIETEFNIGLLRLKIDDYYNTRKISPEIKRDRQLDAIRSVKGKQKKMIYRGTMKNYDDRIADCEKNLETKMIVDFDQSVASSIKFLAVQKKCRC